MNPELETKFDDTVLVIQATPFEVFSLWQEYHKECDWVQENGNTVSIEYLENNPIVLHLCWEVINQKRILFWSVLSPVYSLEVIKLYLDKAMPEAKHTDTWNFWNKFKIIK